MKFTQLKITLSILKYVYYILHTLYILLYVFSEFEKSYFIELKIFLEFQKS